MDTKKLQAILSTVQIGSINKAAEHLGYTQSGLTYMLNSIEEELGIPLLHRCHSGIQFTDMGLELLPYIEDIIRSERALSAKVSSIKGRTRGKITVGVYPSVAIAWLPDAIRAFEKKYPDTKVEIRIGAEEITTWLQTDEIQFGIVEKIKAGSYRFDPLCDDLMYAAIPEAFALAQQKEVTLQQLAAEKLLFSTGNTTNTVFSQFHEMGIKPTDCIDVSTTNGMDLLFMVNQGMGVSFLSSLYQKSCPENVVMIPISPLLKREIGVISKQDRAFDQKTTYFLKVLRCYSKHPVEH